MLCPLLRLSAWHGTWHKDVLNSDVEQIIGSFYRQWVGRFHVACASVSGVHCEHAEMIAYMDVA